MRLPYPPAQAVPLDRILVASLIIIALVVVGLVVVAQVKKRFASEEEADGQPGGFTLSDLRAMHRNGQMSNEEFEKARGNIIEAAKRASQRDAKAADPDRPGRSTLE